MIRPVNSVVNDRDGNEPRGNRGLRGCDRDVEQERPYDDDLMILGLRLPSAQLQVRFAIDVVNGQHNDSSLSLE